MEDPAAVLSLELPVSRDHLLVQGPLTFVLVLRQFQRTKDLDHEEELYVQLPHDIELAHLAELHSSQSWALPWDHDLKPHQVLVEV